MTDSVMRRVRQLALEALYEADTSGHQAEAVYDRRVREALAEDPGLGAGRFTERGRASVRGVVERAAELDAYIAGAASRYPVETMAIVDRNILRLAIWELVTDNRAPVAAVVNEAVELAHRYGGESSPGFVNGVLRTVSERIVGERAAGRASPAATTSTSPSQEH
jgi:N utilization substance protein B